MSPAGYWKPKRKDAFLVGVIPIRVLKVLGPFASMRAVYAVPETLSHIHLRHGEQIDIAMVEGMLWSVIGNPRFVYRSLKPNSVVFVEVFDESHDLLVPIKVLALETWLESAYVERRQRIERRLRERLLYERVGDR